MFLIVLSGCAGKTISDVPTIKTSVLHPPRFSGLTPREMVLVVQDERAPAYRQNHEELVRTLQEKFVEVLAATHVKVSADAPHTLTVQVRDRDALPGMPTKRESCVMINTRLTLYGERAYVESSGSACFELQHGFGFSLGSRIDQSYQSAIDSALQNLDEQLRRLEPQLQRAHLGG